MADDYDEYEDEEEYEEEEEEDGGGSKIIIIVAVCLLLVVGGIGAAYFMGMFDPIIKMLYGNETVTEESDEPAKPEDTMYVQIDEILVTLSKPTSAGKMLFLKLRLSIEVEDDSDHKYKIRELMPRIIDDFSTFARELRIEDIRGAQGMKDLHEQLMLRANKILYPIPVYNVLFSEMIIQ